MALDPELIAHKEWLGYVQPVGLVVSPHALLAAQAHVNKNIVPDHTRFLEWLDEEHVDDNQDPVLVIRDLPGMLQDVFDWEARDLAGFTDASPIPDDLELVLTEYNETLRPTYAVEELDRKDDNANSWQMLIKVVETDLELDDTADTEDRRWHASPQARFERLLREAEVPIGLLFNGTQLRLVYAPRGESSGHITFPVQAMSEVGGRPMFAALHLLLSADRLFTLPRDQRLPAILEASRKYQNEVSTKLAGQVLNALYELLRGFQAADDQVHGELLLDVLEEQPNHVYDGLLTVLMRLVFTLYAEDRGLLSNHPIYANHYSVAGLFERLREDANRYPDTMDQRFGAWAQLLALFRLINSGAEHGDFHLQRRRGHLFNPDRFPFLEGRPLRDKHVPGQRIRPPMVSDGIVFRALQNLLVLDGERLRYRSLDVEQIGSVYETMMGFNLEVAEGRSIALKPVKSHGAPTTINLDELLEQADSKRAKWIKDTAEQKITGEALKLLKDAESPDDAVVALAKKVSPTTPAIIPAGAMILQPSDERRRTGAHYTPRSLTEPIVRTTLEPILKQLVDPEAHPPAVWKPSAADKRTYMPGEIDRRVRLSELAADAAKQARAVGVPHPAQILDLKICDPAMGSGAFLVEACRQLGDELVKAWYAHDAVPGDIPPDEDEVLYARRLVAQRCLYGVDKNDMAVDLAKLSLWLVTLAKDHPFTFLDHALRHGDSLVGLTRKQIVAFHWEPKKQRQFGEDLIQQRLDRATEARAQILNAREDVLYADQEKRLALADEALSVVRLTADACVSAFFAAAKKKDRESRREELLADVAQHYQNLANETIDFETLEHITTAAESLQTCEHPIPPFHWEIEFPEVFARENGGFDAFVGNPPFAGKNTLIKASRDNYIDWLKELHVESHGNSDVVAHFFRRAFDVIRSRGAQGLIATQTIGQGDTRKTGLTWICENGGTIYAARKRIKWPGTAAVTISVVHLLKGNVHGPRILDGKTTSNITAFLFHRGGNDDPAKLIANERTAFIGSFILGMGYTFDDTDSKGVASPVSKMEELIAKNSKNAERIFPYIGWSEVTTSPTHAHHRYTIDFWTLEEEEARSGWPDLMSIVEERVKPERDIQKRKALRERWWQYAEKRPGLYGAINNLERVLVAGSQASAHFAFAFLPKGMVYSSNLTIIAKESFSAFAAIQSRPHEVWSRFFMTTLEDRLVYTPTTCFEHYPFSFHWEDDESLEKFGSEYYSTRAHFMTSERQGLTELYNRFHDPDERSPEIVQLRELHDAMDRAVLEAYGWDDLAASARCEFLLDYEEDEDEDSGKKSKKKKPWRLRWPDEFRDEVLARLLELNEQRHQEEVLAGKASPSKKDPGSRKGPAKRKQPQTETEELFEETDHA